LSQLHGKLREDHEGADEGGDDDHGGRRGVRVTGNTRGSFGGGEGGGTVGTALRLDGLNIFELREWQRQNNQ